VARGQTHIRNVVTISIVPFTPEHESAAGSFNQRMRHANAPTAFLLPKRSKPSRTGPVTAGHYLALDDQRAVRGGMLCHEYPALVRGDSERVLNISAPLSEGIVDPEYTFVGPLLIKHALRQNPRAFVVGMGSATRPLPRLLKSMGWRVTTIPFYFRLLRPARCVRHLAPLRRTPARRLMANVAAGSGIAAVAAAIAHYPTGGARRLTAGFDAEPVLDFDERTDRVWQAFAPTLSFGVERTRATLPFFYPPDPAGPRAWRITRNGGAAGWFGMLVTPMSNNPYFGGLTVATLTDCIGPPEAIRAAMVLAVREATAAGADILITNQCHRALRESCAAAGWRQGPSNFLLATSRALSENLDIDTAYVTRRDGDGLVNLVSHAERVPA
jgi:hypothetical protein